MKRKQVVPRQQALRDVEEALAYDLDEGAEAAALGFIDALQRAYQHLGSTQPRAHRVTPTSWTCPAWMLA